MTLLLSLLYAVYDTTVGFACGGVVAGADSEVEIEVSEDAGGATAAEADSEVVTVVL